jgi:two-component system response regulator PilR (NtrC family)
MPNPTALIVDDEPDILELIEITLGRMNVDTDSVGNLAQARDRIAERNYDLCLADMRLPDGNGIDLVRTISKDHPQTPVAIFTAHGNMESAIEALKAGAFDFVAKPVNLEDLRNLVDQALRLGPPDEQSTGKQLLGDSDAMRDLRERIVKVARSQAPVAIGGESGVGKELVARTIHQQSPRASGPFVPLNCGAIPRELMESELFGHEKGSFTGAVSEKEGLFEAASGGTLFLDEIAELPKDMQVKLLRAIQEKRIRPVGSTREVPVDVRLLSASHRKLSDEVADGRLRQDLFYRINVIELDVPPLRDRPDDIPVLANAIVSRLAAEYGRTAPTLDDGALASLARYKFPGNVRELENILERALALAEADRLSPQDLQLPDTDTAPVAHPSVDDASGTDGAGQESADGENNLDSHLAGEQKRLLLETLENNRWNRTEAARELGLTYRQLRYRLQKLGID